MTRSQATQLGYTLERGAYTGTTDDRADRWYWAHEDDDSVDRRGGGFYTIRDALQSLKENLAAQENSP